MDDKINSPAINVSEKYDEKEKNNRMKEMLPFLSIDTDKNKEFPNITHRLENARLLINSQTDKLLIEGFEGNEEDFKKCYHKLEPIKLKKVSTVKRRKFNKFLIKDAMRGTIRLTKTKEFNLNNNRKEQILAQMGLSKQRKNPYKNIRLKKMNKNYFNNLFYDNNSLKSNQINSSNSLNDKNLYNNSGSSYVNNIFEKSYSNSINRNYGSTFYFYKKNLGNKSNRTKNIKNGSINLNTFMTLRNILNNTSHNISNIDTKLKKYISFNFGGSTSRKNINKTSRFFDLKKSEDQKLKKLLDSFKKKEENSLKLIKKDEGINSQNIWIKRSTANLISFGKSFINLDDNQFYQERDRIMNDYPKIAKEADLSDTENDKKEESFELENYKLKMDKNSKIMNDLNNMNNALYKKLKDRIKELKEKKI